MYPILSKYQQDGYRQAREIANKWKGAFVCDGVGLGKTFIGLMLLEYHLSRGEQILLVVPKSAEKSVWLRNIDRYLRPHYQRALRQHLEIRRHTDFGRPGTISKQDLDYYRNYCDVVIIDELLSRAPLLAVFLGHVQCRRINASSPPLLSLPTPR